MMKSPDKPLSEQLFSDNWNLVSCSRPQFRKDVKTSSRGCRRDTLLWFQSRGISVLWINWICGTFLWQRGGCNGMWEKVFKIRTVLGRMNRKKLFPIVEGSRNRINSDEQKKPNYLMGKTYFFLVLMSKWLEFGINGLDRGIVVSRGKYWLW